MLTTLITTMTLTVLTTSSSIQRIRVMLPMLARSTTTARIETGFSKLLTNQLHLVRAFLAPASAAASNQSPVKMWALLPQALRISRRVPVASARQTCQSTLLAWGPCRRAETCSKAMYLWSAGIARMKRVLISSRNMLLRRLRPPMGWCLIPSCPKLCRNCCPSMRCSSRTNRGALANICKPLLQGFRACRSAGSFIAAATMRLRLSSHICCHAVARRTDLKLFKMRNVHCSTAKASALLEAKPLNNSTRHCSSRAAAELFERALSAAGMTSLTLPSSKGTRFLRTGSTPRLPSFTCRFAIRVGLSTPLSMTHSTNPTPCATDMAVQLFRTTKKDACEVL
eukprot:m.190133 g.190133  ORF g.190133 m.190133 type:complete len:340 (+) comp10575_c0_seq8:3586-4605(+)